MSTFPMSTEASGMQKVPHGALYTAQSTTCSVNSPALSQEVSNVRPSWLSGSESECRQTAVLLMKMRHVVDEQGFQAKGVDDSTLVRFLKARSMNVEKASKMFLNHQKWRASFVPLGCIPESQIPNEMATEKAFLQGTSIQGWPIIVLLSCRHDAVKRDFEEFTRFMVYILDKAIASAPAGVGKFMVIADMLDFSYRNLDTRAYSAAAEFLQVQCANVQSAKSAFYCDRSLGSSCSCSAYYPERLGRVFILNAPYIFLSAWRMLKGFLDTSTQSKIVFVESGQTTQALKRDIPMQTIPKMFGGNAELVRVQDKAVPHCPPVAENIVLRIDRN